MQKKSTGPLSGLKILDFSTMMAGPYCGRWLSDLGADVIKVESPEGDYMRSRPPLRNGQSAYFGYLNSGKKSIVLDLKNPQAIPLVKKLIEQCDILIEGFRPGVMQRLGLDYETLKPSCPGLIYCSISGYGQSGPKARNPAYAAIVHADTGFDTTWQDSQPVKDTPPTCGIQIADCLAATFSTIAIQSALLSKAISGSGQRIDLSLAEGMLSLMPMQIVQSQFPSENSQTLYQPIKTRNGFIMIAPITPKNFLDLCTAIEREDLKTDSRFISPLERIKNWSLIISIMESWASQYDTQACLDKLVSIGVPASEYKSVADTFTDPQFNQRGFYQKASDAAGEFLLGRLPFVSADLHRQDTSFTPTVPSLGEHTKEIFQTFLSLTDTEFSQLSSAGVFGAKLPVTTQ